MFWNETKSHIFSKIEKDAKKYDLIIYKPACLTYGYLKYIMLRIYNNQNYKELLLESELELEQAKYNNGVNAITSMIAVASFVISLFGVVITKNSLLNILMLALLIACAISALKLVNRHFTIAYYILKIQCINELIKKAQNVSKNKSIFTATVSKKIRPNVIQNSKQPSCIQNFTMVKKNAIIRVKVCHARHGNSSRHVGANEVRPYGWHEPINIGDFNYELYK